MSVGIVLITHERLGETLLAQAESLLGPFPAPVRVLGVAPEDDPDRLLDHASRAVSDVDDGAGVLVLTDIFGATPSNTAHRIPAEDRHVVVHGLNLAMLLRAHNYAALALPELVAKVIEGGQRSIFAGQAP